jgi:2,5-diketo-D-gluconate reductase B
MTVPRITEANIPILGLGTWHLEGARCARQVRDALEVGYRHIDTAQAYGNEKQVGEAVRETQIPRKEIFVTTKVWLENLEKDSVVSSGEESLERLGLDYVDLLLIHWPNPDVPLQETFEGMETLHAQKKTMHVGVSNFTPSLWSRALDLAPVICNQVEYHPYLNQVEHLSVALVRDLALIAYCPLARGTVAQDPTLQDVGKRYGKSPAQVTLRWLIQQLSVAAIPKASTREHLEENFDIFDFDLTPGEMERIASLARDRRFIDPSWAPEWRT